MSIDLTRPAPADVLDRLDTDMIEAGLVSFMDDIEVSRLQAGDLRWMLQGFDDDGLATITVLTTLGAEVSSVKVHWSVIVRPAV